MTEAAQQFAQHVMAWRARSQAGQACGIVSCPQTELTPCTLGCGNSYCAEHKQVHFHAVPAPGSEAGPAAFTGLKPGDWTPAAAAPVLQPATSIPNLPPAPLPRPSPPRLSRRSPRFPLNDQECLLLLTTAIGALVMNPAGAFPPAFTQEDARVLLRFLADTYRATASSDEPEASTAALMQRWKVCPLDVLNQVQTTAFMQISCAAGVIMGTSGLNTLVRVLDHVAETDRLWDRLARHMPDAQAELAEAGSSLSSTVAYMRQEEIARDEGGEDAKEAAPAGMIDVVFSFDPADPENWSIDMEEVPDEKVFALSEAMADAARDLMDPASSEDDEGEDPEGDPDGAEGDSSKELA